MEPVIYLFAACVFVLVVIVAFALVNCARHERYLDRLHDEAERKKTKHYEQP